MTTSAPWALEHSYDSTATPSRFWLWTLLVGLAFFIADQDPRMLEAESWDAEVYSADEHSERIAGGNLLRQAMFLSLGLAGVYGLASSQGRKLDWRDPLVLTCVGFLAWAALSVAWSNDPGLSLRRVLRLACVYAAALGLVRHFSPRDFLRMAFAIALGWFVFSIGLELALGRFQPWQENYRFCGMMHPNLQVLQCGVLVLAAVAILASETRPDWFVRGTLLVAGASFLLTRSRTALAAMVVAFVVAWLAKPGGRKLPWVFAAALVASAVGLFAGLFGSGVDQGVANVALLGRSEDVGSLTGRLPLWTELVGHGLVRPLTGYGYGAFWGPERAEIVADALSVRGWQIPHAHSSFIDAFLSLGLIGVTALALTMIVALVRAVKRYHAAPIAESLFLLGLITFGACDALAESSVVEPSFFCFLILCSALQLTFPAQQHSADESQFNWN
ncbi:MAG: O-antigen ligase family protein [Pirellulales bacterium]